MKTMKSCIRCLRCSMDGKSLTCGEIASIYTCHQLDMIEIKTEYYVCSNCRELLGDAVSDKLLKERSKDETNNLSDMS